MLLFFFNMKYKIKIGEGGDKKLFIIFKWPNLGKNGIPNVPPSHNLLYMPFCQRHFFAEVVHNLTILLSKSFTSKFIEFNSVLQLQKLNSSFRLRIKLAGQPWNYVVPVSLSYFCTDFNPHPINKNNRSTYTIIPSSPFTISKNHRRIWPVCSTKHSWRHYFGFIMSIFFFLLFPGLELGLLGGQRPNFFSGSYYGELLPRQETNI